MLVKRSETSIPKPRTCPPQSHAGQMLVKGLLVKGWSNDYWSIAYWSNAGRMPVKRTALSPEAPQPPPPIRPVFDQTKQGQTLVKHWSKAPRSEAGRCTDRRLRHAVAVA
jgi:hypothetical protein